MTGSPGTIVLPAPDRPRASVIIPAWRRAELLRRCLESLARLPDTTPFETVVILNGASDDVAILALRWVPVPAHADEAVPASAAQAQANAI